MLLTINEFVKQARAIAQKYACGQQAYFFFEFK